jgi:PAS domain S-box-containing protein
MKAATTDSKWVFTALAVVVVAALAQLAASGFILIRSQNWNQKVALVLFSLSAAELGAIFLAVTFLRRRQNESPQTNDSLKTISELKEQLQEQKRSLRELIKKAVDVICVINGHGEIVSINPACEAAWGYKPQSLVGTSLYSLLEEGQAGEVMPPALGAAYSINKIVFESRLKKRDGKWLDIILTGHWSATESGFFCIVHDVSEQKEFERMKSEFTSMAVHDVRTPLASVTLFCEMAEKGVLGVLNEKAHRAISVTRKRCEHSLRLLNNMLQLDKIEAGSFKLELASIDIFEVVQDCIEAIEPSAQMKEITLEQRGASAQCVADELRLTQVVLNLLTNAVKYAPEKSKIIVTIEEQKETVMVSVADQGQGIPANKLESIFHRFEQASADDARLRQGIGLGLAICKAIVEQHGGKISVESTVGTCSRFWFSIPAQ